MPAGGQGSVQHLTMWHVPVDVLANMFSLLNSVKVLECHNINPPQEVQCVHMYSVDWDALSLLYISLLDSVLIIDVITYHLV